MRPEQGDGAAIVAVLGPGWAAEAKEDEADRVRRAVEDAFATGRRVVPVVVDGAAPPRADELPPSLAALAAVEPVKGVDDYWEETVDRVIERLEPRGGGGVMALLRRRPKVTVGGTVGIAAGIVGILAAFGVFEHTDPQSGAIDVGERSAVGVTFRDYLADLDAGESKPSYPMVKPGDQGFVYDVQPGLERAEHDRYSIRWTMRDVTTGKRIEPFVGLVGSSFGPRDASLVHEIWVPCPREEARRYVVQFALVDDAKARNPLGTDESPEAECRRVEQ